VITYRAAELFDDDSDLLSADARLAFAIHAGRLFADFEEAPRREWRELPSVVRLHPHRQLYATEWVPGQYATFTANWRRGVLRIVARRIGNADVLDNP
jgi:hypothetical protein